MKILQILFFLLIVLVLCITMNSCTSIDEHGPYTKQISQENKVSVIKIDKTEELWLPGSLGYLCPFPVSIKPCLLHLAKVTDKWKYYTAPKNKTKATFLYADVTKKGDAIGIRISRNDENKKQWFVDNSNFNHAKGVIWTQSLSRSDLDKYKPYEITTKEEPTIVVPEKKKIKQENEKIKNSHKWFLTAYFKVNRELKNNKGYTKEILECLDEKPGVKVKDLLMNWVEFWVTKGATKIEAEALLFFKQNRRACQQNNDLLNNKFKKLYTAFVFDNWVSINSSLPANIKKKNSNNLNSIEWKGYGTGFAVSSKLIVTAFHVIDEAKTIEVKFEDKDWEKVRVKKRSSTTDLAVLESSAPLSNWISISKSPEEGLGSDVFTIGYPTIGILGDEPKYTEGVISSLSGLRNDNIYMQITVPIQPGNSGGPLVNEKGQLVGVVTSSAAIRAFLKFTGTIPQSINWAVKVYYVLPLIPQGIQQQEIIYKTKRELIKHVKSSVCQIRVK